MKKFIFISMSFLILLLISCKKEKEEYPSEELPSVGEFKEFSSTTSNAISSYSSLTGKITFNNFTDQVFALSEGDIIISDECEAAPHGFFRRVSGISSEKKEIYTESLPIEDLINNGRISFMIEPKPFKDSKLKSEEGLFDFSISFNDEVLFDADQNLFTTGDQILLNGHLDFNLEISLTCRFKKGLQYLMFEVEISEEFDAEISSELNGNYFYKEKSLWQEKLPSFMVYVYGIPLRLTPVVEIIAGVEGNPSISNFSVFQTANMEVGTEYIHSSWKKILNFQNGFSWEEPNLSNSFNLKGFAGPRVSLMVWDIIGPFGQIDAFASVETEGKQIYWFLYGGIEAKAGINMGIFSKKVGNPEIDFELVKEEIASGVLEEPGLLNYEIAFVKEPLGYVEEIFLKKSSGFELNLSMHQYPDVNPCFSKDGERVYFCSKRNDLGDIFSVNVLGGDLKKIISSPLQEYHPSVSPNGTQIVYALFDENNFGKLMIASSSGLNSHSILSEYQEYYYPCWNPVSDWIVFQKIDDGGIYKIKSNGTGLIKLSLYGADPCWDPSGTKIYYSEYEGEGNRDIWVMNSNGSNKKRITNTPEKEYHPSISPDGTKIVFQRGFFGSGGFWVMDIGGLNAEFIEESYYYRECVWNPNAK